MPKGVVEALEWRVGRMEECLSAVVRYLDIRMPEPFYDNSDDEDEACASGSGGAEVEAVARQGCDRFEEPQAKPEKLRRDARLESDETPGLRHNDVGELFSIKLVRPSFFHDFDFFSRRFEVGFPASKGPVAGRVERGDFMFIYVMSPEKKIIGLARAVEKAAFDECGGKFPYRLLLEWESGPKSGGITFAELGLKVRPRPGDTVYSIDTDKAVDVAELVRSLPDLTYDELVTLRAKHLEIE